MPPVRSPFRMEGIIVGREMDSDGSTDWRIRLARVDPDDELAQGLMLVDPSTPWESIPATVADRARKCAAFGLFIRLMRRRLGLSIQVLADRADVESDDLLDIESDPEHQPEVRTVHQLATLFEVSESKLLQVAGLTGPLDPRLYNEAVRFVRSCEHEPAPGRPGSTALAAFIVALSAEI